MCIFYVVVVAVVVVVVVAVDMSENDAEDMSEDDAEDMSENDADDDDVDVDDVDDDDVDVDVDVDDDDDDDDDEGCYGSARGARTPTHSGVGGATAPGSGLSVERPTAVAGGGPAGGLSAPSGESRRQSGPSMARKNRDRGMVISLVSWTIPLSSEVSASSLRIASAFSACSACAFAATG